MPNFWGHQVLILKNACSEGLAGLPSEPNPTTAQGVALAEPAPPGVRSPTGGRKHTESGPVLGSGPSHNLSPFKAS